MPIDQEGLTLIDQMLNKIMELQNMPVAWNERQAQDLNSIHQSLLYLNQLWQEFNSEDYLSNISFELRPPLNSIIGYIELLKIEADGQVPKESTQNLDFIETTGTQLLQKINILIDKVRAFRDSNN